MKKNRFVSIIIAGMFCISCEAKVPSDTSLLDLDTSVLDTSVLDTSVLDTSDAETGTPEVKAFPSAEGFGADATGGRGGEVIKVTNLNTSGAGSLQAALDINRARVIVFEVSGVIPGDVNIPYGDVTIAGQTAPGGGITIHGRLECDYGSRPNNIIIRHIRVRADHATNPGIAASQYDGIQCSRSSNLIFDHISLSGGVDETFDLYEAKNFTVQWSIISRSDLGNSHNFGLLNGPDGHSATIHHNLFAHHENRNPALANGPAEVINNVIYNVRHGFIHHNPSTGEFNIEGNYYKKGPSSPLFPFFFDDGNAGGGSPSLSYYMNNNYIDDPDNFVGNVNNPWGTPYVHSTFAPGSIDWGWNSSAARSTQKHSFHSTEVTTHDASVNYDQVLAKAGAFPRDKMSTDDVQEVKDRSGSWGKRLPANLMEGLTPTAPPTDSDNDGMPDAWENNNGLNPGQPDHSTTMASGYTAIEEYINELADAIVQ